MKTPSKILRAAGFDSTGCGCFERIEDLALVRVRIDSKIHIFRFDRFRSLSGKHVLELAETRRLEELFPMRLR